MPSDYKTEMTATDMGGLPVLARTTTTPRGESTQDQRPEDKEPIPPVEDESHQVSEGLIPLKYRLTAVAMILFISTGTAFAEVTMGPLKSTLQRELGLNNVQFATISTASNLVNTLLPAIGGIVMDYFGAGHTALAACVTCIIGSVVAACSANTGQHSLLIVGRILLGFGSIVIEICQNKLYAHWFAGSTLSFVVAIDLAWNSLTSIIARLSAVPMSRLGGWYGWALWIPSFVIMFCTLIVIAYILFERKVPREYRPSKGADTTELRGLASCTFLHATLSYLGGGRKLNERADKPMFFWILCGTEIFQNAARTVYSVNLADIQEKTRGTSTLAAGYNSSLQNIVTVFMVPAIGLFFDKFGWRMPFVSIGAALYIVVFALIGLTTVHPLGPIVLSSFALSMNVIPFIGSIPILVNDPSKMGTAYGVWSSFVACNNILLEVTAGAVQDATPGQTYERVIYLLIAIKAVQVLLGPIYDYLDGRLLGHSLRRSEKRRLAMRDAKLAKGEEYPGWKVHKPTTWFFGMQYTGMVLVSWVIFFVYSVARR